MSDTIIGISGWGTLTGSKADPTKIFASSWNCATSLGVDADGGSVSAYSITNSHTANWAHVRVTLSGGVPMHSVDGFPILPMQQIPFVAPDGSYIDSIVGWGTQPASDNGAQVICAGGAQRGAAIV